MRNFGGLMKFSLLLSVRLQGRLLVSPFVAAFWAIWKEVERMHAEIDAYLAKEAEEESYSGKR